MTPARRDNGLPASQWAPLVEVDPRVADALLELLRQAGIPAYTTPATTAPGPYLEVRLPTRPVDRLHVDAARREEAERLVQEHGGVVASASQPLDEDAAFAAIVAGWEQPSPTERLALPPLPREDDPGAGGGTGAPGVAAGPRDWSPAPEDAHYEPPPAPPLPRPSRATALSLAILVGGIVLLLVTATRSDPSAPLQLLSVLLILGGAGLLIARMRERAEPDEDSDDGAVV